MRLLTRVACIVILCAGLIMLSGCGGGNGRGNGSGATAVPVRFDIAWGDRSRAITAPASALSATLTLANANPSGADFVYTVNREATLTAYTGHYASTSPARVGSWTLTMHFYTQPDGQGDVVGIAGANVTIKPDGTGIGDVNTQGTIASVEVAGGQHVPVGTVRDLAVTAKDAQCQIIAVAPGSAAWTLVQGDAALRFSPDGLATGLTQGTPAVMVTLEGLTSAAQTIAVIPLRYTAMELLPPPGFPSAIPTTINSKGQVSGFADTGAVPATRHACFWASDGKVKDLGVLPGYENSLAEGMNDSGQVVGYCYHKDPESRLEFLRRACLWNPDGSLIDLGVLPGDTSSVAQAINNAGQIVGFSLLESSTPPGSIIEFHTFLWTKQRGMQDLGTLAGAKIGDVWGINGSGQIAALISPLGPPAGQPALLTPQGGGYSVRLFDGPIPPNFAENSYFTGLNSSGTVLGYTQSSDGRLALTGFLLSFGDNSSFISFLQTLPDSVARLKPVSSRGEIQPRSINDANLCAGRTGSSSLSFATLWMRDGSPTLVRDLIVTQSNLPFSSDNTASDLYGINNRGQTVGTIAQLPGIGQTGAEFLPYAFVLSPQ